MSNLHFSNSVWQGTATGAVFSILPWINIGEILKTIILSALGITVSFTLSLALEKIRKHSGKRPPSSGHNI